MLVPISIIIFVCVVWVFGDILRLAFGKEENRSINLHKFINSLVFASLILIFSFRFRQ